MKLAVFLLTIALSLSHTQAQVVYIESNSFSISEPRDASSDLYQGPIMTKVSRFKLSKNHIDAYFNGNHYSLDGEIDQSTSNFFKFIVKDHIIDYFVESYEGDDETLVVVFRETDVQRQKVYQFFNLRQVDTLGEDFGEFKSSKKQYANDVMDEKSRVTKEFDDKYLTFKCGTVLGVRKEFIDLLIDSVPEEYKNAYKDPRQTFSCMLDALVDNYTAKEVNSFVELYGSPALVMQNLLLDQTSQFYEQYQECVLDENINQDYHVNKNDENVGNGFYTHCIRELRESEFGLDGDIYEYCGCLRDKLLDRGFSLNDLNEIEDENSVLFNEVLINCRTEILSAKSIEQEVMDVIGSKEFDVVRITDYYGSYRVKLRIGDFDKYFTIDTGASDVLIDQDFERELILEGVINKSNYLSDETYTLATGEQVILRTFHIDHIEIGNYSVRDVVVAVGNENASFLLGNSFFNKFSSFSIDKKNSQLILKK